MTAVETAADFDTDFGDEDFEALLEESFANNAPREGMVMTGTVVAIENDFAIVDVGLKSEGRIQLREFGDGSQASEVKVGDSVEVFLERYEDKNGDAVLSREKARREESWRVLESAFESTTRVTGTIFGRVKGGFTVDLDGAIAFLPGSQVDIRPIRDIEPLMGAPQPFQILKMDRARGNIVVSRRAVLEESRAEARSELISGLEEGQKIIGVVKNITDYGAFVDLGGVDGLLHVTDISWKRINHPSEELEIGQQLEVQIIRFNRDTQRISLGLKQLQADPWDSVETTYAKGTKHVGRVTNITDYGSFVELQPGIEGLVHISEMSWTRKNVHPGKIVSTSQEVEVVVLNVDTDKRRVSLGIKQCLQNPWEAFAEQYPTGSELEGTIRNITEFGLFISMPGDIDGMAHMSDLDWTRSGEDVIKDYSRDEAIKVKVLDIDIVKERISLGVKQLTEAPEDQVDLRKGKVVTCMITALTDGGLEVDVNGISGFIRKSELSKERSEQRSDRFSAGEKLDAVVTVFDKAKRTLNLSVKALDAAEEKKAMAEYGSSNSGASLGDILGEALRKRTGDDSDQASLSSTPVSEESEKASDDEKETDTETAPKKASEDTSD